jgi:hypothetical protein
MIKRLRKMPRDVNQLAKAIVDLSSDAIASEEPLQKDPHAQALGSKGGRARKEKLSPTKRRKIARQAAKARWGN